MKTLKKVEITPLFVDYIPNDIDQNTLYVSKKYETAVHLCLCGCGNKSVTPIGAGQWVLTEKNDKVSLSPSILNRACGSHYILTNNVANFV